MFRKGIFQNLICLSTAFIIFFPLTVAAAQKKGRADDGKPVTLKNSSITILKDRDYLPALKEAIDKAEKEIAMSFFYFKTEKAGDYPDAILNSLIAAAKRGVAVTVILEQGGDAGESPTRENRKTVRRLKKKGVQVYLDSRETTTHTKMAVVDGRFTFIGSHNLTQSALRYNNEMSVMIESTQVADEALEYIRSLISSEGRKKDEASID